MESNLKGAGCRQKDRDRNILKTGGMMWIGLGLPKAGTW
jgi:hypothetical protein